MSVIEITVLKWTGPHIVKGKMYNFPKISSQGKVSIKVKWEEVKKKSEKKPN